MNPAIKPTYTVLISNYSILTSKVEASLLHNFEFLIFLDMSIILTLIGLSGIILLNRSIVHLLVSIELCYLGLVGQLAFFSGILSFSEAYIYILLLLCVVAAESIILCSLIITHYKLESYLLAGDYYAYSKILDISN